VQRNCWRPRVVECNLIGRAEEGEECYATIPEGKFRGPAKR